VVLAHDREAAVMKNAAWRSLYYANIKLLGLGIGAMVRMKKRHGLHRHYNPESGGLWMVLRHEWENMNHVNGGERSVLVQQISNVGRRVYLTVPHTLSEPSLKINGWEVVSPSYDFGMPADWISGESGIDALFENKDKDSRVI
tara:strand:+ start:98 stop:526 length:429 start_codon:yes stop_codon:yes gene_type:complete